MEQEKRLLKIFDWLRFPLIILVIFIHNHPVGLNSCISDNWGGVIVNFVSQGLARLAVPIFFFISGYLFFYKVQSLDFDTYKCKLKRRIKSLLVPYLIWNFLILGLYIIFYLIYGKSSKFENGISLMTLIKALIGIKAESGTFPIAYQMWFIRDLFCIVLISPLIYYLINKLRLLYIVLVAGLWISGFEIPMLGEYCLSMAAIFYFSFGAYFVITNTDVLKIAKEIKYLAIIYPIILCVNLFIKSPILHNIGIICGIGLVFLVCGYFEKKGKLSPIPFLTSSSFLIFAIHAPFLLPICRKILLIVNSTNPYYVVLSYFLSVMLTVGIALGIYYLMKRYIPKITSIITGSR